eukprot:1140615-Pelagomonas_calceolata.AAC.5
MQQAGNVDELRDLGDALLAAAQLCGGHEHDQRGAQPLAFHAFAEKVLCCLFEHGHCGGHAVPQALRDGLHLRLHDSIGVHVADAGGVVQGLHTFEGAAQSEKGMPRRND